MGIILSAMLVACASDKPASGDPEKGQPAVTSQPSAEEGMVKNTENVPARVMEKATADEAVMQAARNVELEKAGLEATREVAAKSEAVAAREAESVAGIAEQEAEAAREAAVKAAEDEAAVQVARSAEMEKARRKAAREAVAEAEAAREVASAVKIRAEQKITREADTPGITVVASARAATDVLPDAGQMPEKSMEQSKVDGAAVSGPVGAADQMAETDVIPGQKLQDFMARIWKWLGAVLLVLVAGWLWKRWASQKASAGNNTNA